MCNFKKTTEYANAKINLYLDVTGSRDDGYHDIVSVMQTVDLCDRLDISARLIEGDTRIRLMCNWDHIPCDERNLVWKAVERFCEMAEISLDIEIYLEKNIPSEAGLAGGSADAAATLRALRREFAPGMPIDMLDTCAASLGSDIPFCLHGGSVICTGRGEVMARMDPLPTLDLVIVKSDERVSTAKAYGKIDSLLPSRTDHPTADAIKKRFVGASVKRLCDSLYNAFEEAVLPECPIAAKMKQELIAVGAINSLMTGSGSAVFGIFENSDAAMSAAKQIGENAVFARSSSENEL